jgi:hypothetical protein
VASDALPGVPTFDLDAVIARADADATRAGADSSENAPTVR